jgi:hypothetical protein
MLTASVCALILAKHPEVGGFLERVGDVLADPEQVRQSQRDERTALFYRMEPGVLGGKWVVVVIKQLEQHFVSTIYATDRIKSGNVLWTRSE